MRTSIAALLALASHPVTLVDAASILFTDATIITFNTTTSRTEVLHSSSLLIEGSRITQIFNGITPTSFPADTEIVSSTGKIISPGFINTHHHLWQTAFKTIASNTTLAEYFQRYSAFGPAIQHFTPEDKYLGQLVGSLELLNSGTTTVVDHAHGGSSDATVDAILNATLDSHLRTYHAFAIQNLPNNYTTASQIEKLTSLANDARLTSNPLVELGLAYDAFDSTPTPFLANLWNLVSALNLSLVTTHTLGGPWITSNSPSTLNTLGWMNTSVPLIFSHASFLTAPDIDILRRTNQYISSTPESEMHYGHTHPVAHVNEVLEQVSLGIDTHFTFSGDMVGQARLWLQTLRLQRYADVVVEERKIPLNNPMSVEQAFYLITRAGAMALRRPDLGAIAVNHTADLVVFDGESVNMLGWSDAVAAVVLHANTGDVQGVVVGGEWVKKEGRLVYGGWEGVKKRFITSAKRVQKIWGGMEWNDLDAKGKWRNVTDWGWAEEVDVARGEGTGY
jgi:cytosine/adenosine deaminase-related metal-dependent hydrolase